MNMACHVIKTQKGGGGAGAYAFLSGQHTCSKTYVHAIYIIVHFFWTNFGIFAVIGSWIPWPIFFLLSGNTILHQRYKMHKNHSSTFPGELYSRWLTSPPPLFSLSYVNFSLILCADFPYNTQMAPRRLISLLGLGVRPWPWRLTPWRWGTLQWTPKWQKTGVSPFPRALWDVLPEVKLSLQVKKIENFILHNHKYTPCLFCFRIHPHGYQL